VGYNYSATAKAELGVAHFVPLLCNAVQATVKPAT